MFVINYLFNMAIYLNEYCNLSFKMKGVILAGGKGLRLYPLTKVTNKHLLPVGNEPMIFNPIKKLKEAGIKDIMIITSTEHMGDIVELLGSGEEFGVNFTYRVQESATGIAHALSLARNFAKGVKIMVILGDQITTGSLKNAVEIFESNGRGAKVFLKEVHDPSRYGVATIQDQSVTEIEEKPSQPKSNYAVIGYYLFDEKVFDIISKIKPSERGEYEITDVNNEYIKLGELSYEILDGEWTDAGTFESLLHANKMLMPEEKSPYLVSQEQVGKMIDEIESKLAELRKHQML